MQSILPRAENTTAIESTFSETNKTKLCSNYKNICNINGYTGILYDYILKIAVESKTVDLKSINGIDFPYSAYFMPLKYENAIIKAGRKVLIDISAQTLFSKKNKFPIYMHTNNGPIFVIKENDVDHLKKIIQLYDSIPCLKPAISDFAHLSKNYRRFLYHITKKTQNYGQVIHFSQNVQMLYSNWAYITTPDTKRIYANHTQGQLISSFTDNLDELYRNSIEMSIRDLNIDVEYVSYLIKTYANFC